MRNRSAPTRPPCGKIQLSWFHEANPPWGRGWPLPHPAQHKKPPSSCPLAATFAAREAVFTETTDTKSTWTHWRFVLQGRWRRCRFRTAQHCWGRTVTGGRWRGRSSLLWWTPPETAYLKKIKKIKSHIAFEVLLDMNRWDHMSKFGLLMISMLKL